MYMHIHVHMYILYMYIHVHTVHVHTCTCTSIHTCSSKHHFKNRIYKTHIDIQYTHYTSSGKLNIVMPIKKTIIN